MGKKIYLLAAVFLMNAMPALAVWDESTPAGTEAKSLGDDRLRELKTDIRLGLTHEGDFPGPDTSNPRFIWTPSSGTSAQRPSGSTNTATGMMFINRSSNTVEQYTGASWVPIASLVPSGYKMLFVGNSCPGGWTLDTSSEGYSIRTTTTASQGGAVGGSTDISTASWAHTHYFSTTTASSGSHSHTVNSHLHEIDYTTVGSQAAPTGAVYSQNSVGAALGTNVAGGGGTNRIHTNITTASSPGTDSQGAHTHTLDGNTQGASISFGIIKYMNVVVCTAP